MRKFESFIDYGRLEFNKEDKQWTIDGCPIDTSEPIQIVSYPSEVKAIEGKGSFCLRRLWLKPGNVWRMPESGVFYFDNMDDDKECHHSEYWFGTMATGEFTFVSVEN